MKTGIFSARKSIGYAATLLLVMCAMMHGVEPQPGLAANRALLVGVEDYPNQKNKLRGIRDDVGLLETALTNTGLFAKQEIKTLLDKQATKANVTESFRKWLVNDSNQGDTVLFYFSGHGIRVWDETGEKPDGQDSAVVCWDTQILKPKVRRNFRGVPGTAHELSATRNLLLGREFHGLLKQLQGRRVIFMSDSCHSGTVYKQIDPFFAQIKTIMDDEPIGYKSVFEPRTSSEPEKAILRKAPRIVDFEIPGVEFVAFTASEDSQPAQVVNFPVDPKGHHSVFTWFLLHGLAGAAARDGAITFGNLAEFIGYAVKKAGFAQDPQTVFSPKTLANQPLVKRSVAAQRPATQTTVATAAVPRPTELACLSEAGPGVSPSDLQKLKSKVELSLSAVKWTDRKDQAACRIVLEKSSGSFGAQLSDATGDYWETNTGSDLEAVASRLAGNMRAYYIHMALAALNNPSGRRQVDINIAVKGPKQRAQREAVNGDSILFEAETKTGGYPYIFSVDTVGVIHPLYPLPASEVRQLQPGTRGFLGTDNSFTVAEPFGKEMVFAIMVDKPPASFASLWGQDHIGDARQESFQPQQQFLDTLWTELASSGKPKGDWTSRSWVIRSFRQ